MISLCIKFIFALLKLGQDLRVKIKKKKCSRVGGELEHESSVANELMRV